MRKVVFHLSDLNQWFSMFGNVSHFLKSQDMTNVDVQIVVNGDAITRFTDDKIVNTIKEIGKKTDLVRFNACNNALKGHNMSEHDLPNGVQIVPSGILKIVELQESNYAYIKC